VAEGKLVAAAEEERFRRIKHWAGLPTESIRYCLKEAGISLNQVDAIAINQDAKANLWKKIGFMLTKRPDFGLVLDRIRNKRVRESIESQLSRAFPDQHFNGKVHAIEHHLAHLYSAFYVSPFEEAVAISVDGFGDFSSGAWGVGRGRDIKIDSRVFFPHSLGIFYQALTQYLGFPHYGDEYKVMGLAPYGTATYLDEMRRIVKLQIDGSYQLNLDYFRHHKEKVAYEWENGAPVFGSRFSDKMAKLLGPVRQQGEELTQRHKDIARSIQAMYEEAFFHLLNTLHRNHRLDAVTVAGGCGMNSVANGKITRNTPFNKVYIQSAAGDAGGAIGSAFAVWNSLDKNTPRFVMDHAYWGPEFSTEEVGKVLGDRSHELEEQGCTVKMIDDEGELCRKTAEEIAEGKVIGWFQGRMEWGPRALVIVRLSVIPAGVI
jgi:carbamoyltransferase